MSKETRAKIGKPLLQRLVRLLLITMGAAVYSAGMQFFMYPNNVISGGLTGVAMIINQLSGLPVGTMLILMNVPLFVVAWRHFGLDFMLGSLAGTVLSSVCIDLFAMTGLVLTDDIMLACIIGGVIKGAGLGLIYNMGATTGGIDIVTKLLRQKSPHLNFGTIMLLLDAVIIVAYALILNKYESAMYSIIGMFVVSKVVDLALYGIDISNVCYIISDKSKDIIREITAGNMHRGVTVLEARGAYTGKEKPVVMTVIKRQQIGEIRRIVRSIDENAFFIVTDAKNVFGNGFENISEVK